ncbi:MAG: hypothetical protein A3C02_00625 [Candidatus Andersenbacteria bacterium RIFCSPHIGHO2_02_FULL_45_11]|uniref:Uncharacterized protein n=1 Tax=Candidatus Andersenbacteria bacterium RIFCSPHIGHO2_12_FULL_45_11 TaxID=1797281 RepID=A0A1G1X3X7_9BACT|nr:MAG: hypothetical protein A2805_02575 [Candidatus Andersenbacteria bacterium RIFCSPHIGHO2_01_FULL_46_36]OGY31902.1 MAG: hypothetical protein A3C02_00625 [Candidatus Andersenbacteria bacterium RIFCSPHIGHO2_02_FULL_45_11]OGY34027.1 MAG: hypothetical protein A3D99_02095 [Candidatus Andersenbacteria bacterium RIFCSPHIGHO2_12_FULL_45_11]
MQRSRYKELAVVGFVALYTVVFFSFAALLFAGQQEFTVSSTSGISVAGIIWVAIVAMASILAIDKTAVALTIAIIPSITLLFVGRLSYAAMVGAALMFVLTYIAQKSIYSELGRYVRIRMSTICSFGIRMLLFGMLLSFVVFSIPLIQQSIGSGKISIPEQYVKNATGLYFQNPDQVATGVTDYVRSRAQNNSLVVVVLVIAVALLAVRTVVPIIMWPALGLVVLLFWIARKAGLIMIAQHDAPIEYIEL